MDLTRRYAYNLRWGTVAIGVLFVAGISLLLAHLARSFEGVRYGLLIILSAMFAVLALVSLTRRLLFSRVLELTENEILFPHGPHQTQITRIPYADIIRISENCIHRQAYFIMITTSGSFEIDAVRLPDDETYHAVRDFIYTQTAVVMPSQDEGMPAFSRTWEKVPESTIEWVEPEVWPRYRTHLVVSTPLLPRLAKALWFFVRCFAIFFIPWLMLRFFGLTTEPALFLVPTICGTMFITLIYHWFATIYPARATKITFRCDGITQVSGKQTRDLSCKDFSGWAMVERTFEGRILYILLLKWRTAYVLEFVLPDNSTRDRLVQLLNDKKIPQSPDLMPPWELCQ